MKPEPSGNETQHQPIDPVPRGPAAAARGVCGKQARKMRGDLGNVLLLTTLGAVDGTIILLAATGGLTSLEAAITVGLTVITGAGAWIAAREAFAGPRYPHDGAAAALGRHTALVGIALISTVATVTAAWLGASLGQAMTFHVLPKVAGIVLGLVALEVGGVRLPRPGHVPAPLAVIAAGISLEVAWAWIP